MFSSFSFLSLMRALCTHAHTHARKHTRQRSSVHDIDNHCVQTSLYSVGLISRIKGLTRGFESLDVGSITVIKDVANISGRKPIPFFFFFFCEQKFMQSVSQFVPLYLFTCGGCLAAGVTATLESLLLVDLSTCSLISLMFASYPHHKVFQIVPI